VCVSFLSNIIHTMALLGWFISSSSSQQSHHSICTPPRFSPVALANSQCLLTFFSLRPCLDYGGNPIGAQPGTKTCLAWPFNLILTPHLCTTLFLIHPLPLASLLRAIEASCLFPHHVLVDSSGSTSWGI
jgi:hypothetical protein